ncbi:MAG: efflux RND transporter periplasmic adaptor subunit [Hydrogenophaga sp.]
MSTTPKRSRQLHWWLLVGLAAALSAGLYRAIDKKRTQQTEAMAAAEALQTAPVYELTPADVFTLAELPLRQTVAVSGSLQALQTAAIKARVAGEVQGLEKREGDPVRAGEVVARIDSTEAQARVRQASRQADAAKAQADIARRNAENNQALVRQGFISATALETSSANLAGAQANHEAALAALDIARKALGDTTLRSPISGMVAARPVQNGERVGVDARVLEVVDLSAFELVAAIAPADAVPVQPGQTAQLRVEGLAQPIPATVARINPSVQAGSRSVLVYLKVPAQAGMRQGLFAQGSIEVGQASALAVPVSAVRNDKPQPYLQALDNGRVVHLPVPPGPVGQYDGEPMQQVAGLKPGTVVLRSQAGAIRAGTQVRVGAAAAPN